MIRLKLRNAWMVLNRTNGSILSTVRRTRRESIDAQRHNTGSPWEHHKKMGDVCIRVAIYTERPWTSR